MTLVAANWIWSGGARKTTDNYYGPLHSARVSPAGVRRPANHGAVFSGRKRTIPAYLQKPPLTGHNLISFVSTQPPPPAVNTLRQLAARIVRQCAVAAACAFNAVCVMQRCCAAPLPRKFEIKFALRRIGILTGFAVCVLTFAATDAQAQTSCDAGERSVVASSTGCVSNADADIADACIAADWTIGGFPPNNLRCNIRVRLYNRDGGSNFNSRCAIVEPSVDPSCRLMFGDPPQFPDKAKAVNLATDIYVANCSRDGTIPNTIPATVNTIGATECTCDSSIGGVTGAWPNCACPTGQGVLASGVCGACASGEGVLDNGACGACTGGEGVLANGVCGDCPAGGIPINGVCTCPDGEGRRDDNTCGDCPAGRILQNGICTSCPTGQGVLASGVCGVCTGGEGVLANGACGVCTGGQSVQDGVCQCPAGKIFTDGNCVTPTPAQKCTLAGWTYDPYTDPTFLRTFGEGDCDIPTVNSKTGNSESLCDINSPESNSRRCVIRFGPNYDFPMRPSDGSKPTYVYNCDPDDETGLIPATINTIGATSCACPAGGSAVNGVCACPTGQVVEGDACAACTDGRVVIEGACACPTGGVLFNGVCTCPDGEGVRDDNTCGVCLSGTTLQNGICTSCPAGQLIKSGVCAAPTTPEEKCTAAKWSYNFGEDACYINFKISGGSNQMACKFDDAPAFLNYIPCEDVFGADYSLPFKPSGSNPVYVYNCDPDDESGLIPATVNTIGATECTCPAGHVINNGVCVCPSGQGLLDNGSCGTCPPGQEVIDNVCIAPTVLMDLCEGAGWGFSTSENSCGVLLTLSGGAASDKCYLFGSTSPQCADVFASTVHYFPSPTLAADGATLRFVYNCDPDGESGLIPAMANTIAATECGCESGASLFNDVCIREEGDLGLADELLCGAFGGTVQTATGGKEVCSGMDANDTFCIMDSAAGFPCRGLFKHLRSCNLEFNRKALNPFFCGEKCGNMEAVGKDCVSL